jgi:PAS domain S-box-containing protein
METHAAPLQAPDGAFAQLAVSLDITSRKEAEQAQRRLAAIVESSSDAIIGRDLNGIVTSWNPAAERVLGYSAEEMIGRPIATIVPSKLGDREKEILETIGQEGDRIERFETVRLTRSGEEIRVSLTVSPVRDEAGRVVGVATIARDITQKKKTEHALRTTERLASIGRMALPSPTKSITLSKQEQIWFTWRRAAPFAKTFRNISIPSRRNWTGYPISRGRLSASIVKLNRPLW